MTTLTDTGWWSRFRNRWFSRTPRLDKGGTAEPYTGSQTASGSHVNADTALKLSAVWACVRLRSQTIASLPLHLRDTDRKIMSDHDVYRIIHHLPNADMCASEFWEAMSVAMDLWGNAYALIHRQGKRIVSLDILNPECMSVSRSKVGDIEYKYKSQHEESVYSESEIFHLKGFSIDGLVGLSPIKYAATILGAQIDANDAAQHEFKNHLKVGGFIKTGDRVLQEEQRQGLRKKLATFSQPENAGKFMVLEAGMDVASSTGIRMNPQDAQLLESRYFGIEEICRAFGVPPQLIYHTDKSSSWASSLEQTNMGFLTYSLRPTLVRIEQTISRKLLTAAERLKLKPKFSVEGLLRADSQGRAAFYSQMLQNGVMTRNEVRLLEDLPPIQGGDKLTAQLNLTTIDRIGMPVNNQLKTQDIAA